METDSWLHDITPNCTTVIPRSVRDKFIIRKKSNVIFSLNSNDIIGRIIKIRTKSDTIIHFISLDDSLKNTVSELCRGIFVLVENNDCFIFLSGIFSTIDNFFWKDMMSEMKEKYNIRCLYFITWEKNKKSRGLIILTTEKYFPYFKEIHLISFGQREYGIGIEHKNGEIFWVTQCPVDFSNKDSNGMTKIRQLFIDDNQIVCIVGNFYDATTTATSFHNIQPNVV